jgi:hypothetical protein
MNRIGKIAASILLLLASAWPMQQKSNQKQDQSAQKPQSQPSQDAGKQQSQDKNADQQQPAPLFKGQSNLKSSRQGKDVAVMGFNGIGPNGQVEKKMLEASANTDDEQKAAKMSTYTVSSADVTAFAQEGKLNASSKGSK